MKKKDEQRPIIVKKINKIAAGHHGGAWKLAYSDFVTAMMAFFLLMWLLGSTTEGEKKGIADYFANPWKPSLQGGSKTGDATSIIKGGGEDITSSYGQIKRTNTGALDKTSFSAKDTTGYFVSNKSGTVTSEPKEVEIELDARNLQKTKDQLQELVNKSEFLSEYSGQLKIDITTEGLRIQILDQDKRPMFNIGSTKMENYAVNIIHQIAPVIEQLPNRISITGHTDALHYSSRGKNYSNWELSSDRANAARRELVNGGVNENKFFRMVGLADSVNLDSSNPLNPINRRISIIIMNRNTEQLLIKNSGDLSKPNIDELKNKLAH